MKSPSRSTSQGAHHVTGLIESSPSSDRLILRVLFFATIFAGIFLLFTLNEYFSSPTPIQGGVFREGIVGTPRFVNPTLAITRADQDVTALVYSGLMKIDTNGELTPDVAESITVSDDGLTYNVIVRKDIRFHDGTPLTARDVAYTIELIQNADLKSPLRGNWSDVSVELLGEYELNIVLKEPYMPFIENFQFGILPSHLWSSLPIEQIPFSQLNTEPVGSGSFKVERVIRDESGLITSYILTAYRDNPTKPNIDSFEIQFYSDEATLVTALLKHTIDATAYISTEQVTSVVQDEKYYRAITEPVPRVFGVFFNQNKSAALRDPAVREALSLAIDRDKIIEESLHGFGVPMTSPVPDDSSTLQSDNGSRASDHAATVEQAKQMLHDAGWIKNNLGLLEKQVDGNAETLAFTIKTSNVELFTTITETVTSDWQALGVEISTEQYEQTGLVQSVIRPRDFQALLFGLDMNRSGDLYPFWHSSQKDDPGLNIAQYTNLSVDAVLEENRTEQDKTMRHERRTAASSIISQERPAVFLFQPMMVYIVNKDVIISNMDHIARPSDRFSNSAQWYTDSDMLWNIFRNNN